MDHRQRLRARRSRDSIIQVDTAYAEWQGAAAAGAGSLGWAAPHTGQMAFTLVADSLIGFDSLLLAVTGQKRDTSPELLPLGGQARGSVRLSGSLDTLDAAGDLTIEGFEFQQMRSPRSRGRSPGPEGSGRSSPRRRPPIRSWWGTWTFTRNGVALSGYADSLGWSARQLFRHDSAGGWSGALAAARQHPSGVVRQPPRRAAVARATGCWSPRCSRSAAPRRR